MNETVLGADDRASKDGLHIHHAETSFCCCVLLNMVCRYKSRRKYKMWREQTLFYEIVLLRNVKKPSLHNFFLLQIFLIFNSELRGRPSPRIGLTGRDKLWSVQVLNK